MVWPIIVGSVIGATYLTRSDRTTADPPVDPEDDYVANYKEIFLPYSYAVNPKTGERIEITNNELGDVTGYIPGDKWDSPLRRIGISQERLLEMGFVPEHEYHEGSEPDADPKEK